MKIIQVFYLLLILLIVITFNTANAQAKYVIPDNVVRIGEGLRIEQNTDVSGFVLCIGGPIKILGEVDNSVVCIGHTIMVYGKVRGSVISIGGGIRVDKNAVISGNVLAVGGEIKVDPEARVIGDIIKKKYKTYHIKDFLYIFGNAFEIFRGLGKVIIFISLILFSFILRNIFRKKITNIAAAYNENKIKILFVGLVSYVSFLILFLFLFVTLVFIPFVPVLIFILLIFILCGLIAFNTYIEDKYCNKIKYISKFPLLNISVSIFLWLSLIYLPYKILWMMFFIVSSFFLGAFVHFALFLDKVKVKYNK